MEKDIKLGTIGDLDISLSGGKASVTLKAESSVPGMALTAQASMVVTMDAAALADKLFAAIEKASPPGAVPIEEGVKMIVKEALAKL